MPICLDIGVVSKNDIQRPFEKLTYPYKRLNTPWKIDILTDPDRPGDAFNSYEGGSDTILRDFLETSIQGFSISFGATSALMTVLPPKAFGSPRKLWRILVEGADEWGAADMDEIFNFPGIQYVIESYDDTMDIEQLEFVTKENFPWGAYGLIAARIH